jgi:hypothetical protein
VARSLRGSTPRRGRSARRRTSLPARGAAPEPPPTHLRCAPGCPRNERQALRAMPTTRAARQVTPLGNSAGQRPVKTRVGQSVSGRVGRPDGLWVGTHAWVSRCRPPNSKGPPVRHWHGTGLGACRCRWGDDGERVDVASRIVVGTLGVADVTGFVGCGGCEWVRRRGVFRSPGRALRGVARRQPPRRGGGRQLGGT